MVILGINGWHTRSHHPSACLVKKGKILAMVEEERLIRQKYAFDKVPINAINYCLKEKKVTPDEIGIVAFGWDYRLLYSMRQRKFPYKDSEILDIIFPRKIFKYNKKPKLLVVPHHMAHAASVFFTSGLRKAAILILDGQGETSSTSIAYGEDKTKFVYYFESILIVADMFALLNIFKPFLIIFSLAINGGKNLTTLS